MRHPTEPDRHAKERYDLVICVRCGGDGQKVECMDDICHGKGRCIHGNNTCKVCNGRGWITRELRNRWWNRDQFETIDLPPIEKKWRGLETGEEA